jgi:CBS domain-containing protein
MYEFLNYRVEDVMTSPAVAISPEASLADAQELFERHDFNTLPVMDANGVLVGVLSKLDVLAAFRFTEDHMFPPYEEIMKRLVRDEMATELYTVTPRAPLTRVLEKLVREGVKSFPVVDGDRLVGMVAREDVLGALRRASAGEPPPPRPDEADY